VNVRRNAITRCLLAMTLCACVDEPPCGASVGDMCLIAGTGETGFNSDGLRPGDTDLYLVSAARRGPDDRVYIMDFNNQRLRRIGDDGLIETIVGSGFHAIADVEAPLRQTPLENPIDFGFFADGRLVFVSYHDPRVLVISDDGTLDVIAGAGDGIVGTIGDEGDGGPASEALFIQLDGIAIADDDTIYVSDSLANRVRKIEDGMIETVAGTGEAAYSGDGGLATEAALRWPTALQLDRDGNLYITDTFNHAIRRLDTDGTISTVAGMGSEGHGGDGGPATAAQLSEPFGLAVDADGTLYIGDRGNFKIRRVGPDGLIDTIAGIGIEGIGTEGPASASKLGYVARVALDGDDLLVADQSSAMIWRIRLR
jgi:hypothetical protein